MAANEYVGLVGRSGGGSGESMWRRGGLLRRHERSTCVPCVWPVGEDGQMQVTLKILVFSVLMGCHCVALQLVSI